MVLPETAGVAEQAGNKLQRHLCHKSIEHFCVSHSSISVNSLSTTASVKERPVTNLSQAFMKRTKSVGLIKRRFTYLTPWRLRTCSLMTNCEEFWWGVPKSLGL